MNAPTPDLRPAKGGWLAVSPAGSRFRIAVIGESKDLASDKFVVEWAEWVKLADLPIDGETP